MRTKESLCFWIRKCYSRNKKLIFALWYLQQLQGQSGRANGAACDPLWAGERPASSGFIQLPVQFGTWPWDDITVWPAQDPAADPHPLPAGKTPHHPHSESTQPSLVTANVRSARSTRPVESIVAWTVQTQSFIMLCTTDSPRPVASCQPTKTREQTHYFVWLGLFWAVILYCLYC